MPWCISKWYFSLSLPKAGGDPLPPCHHQKFIVKVWSSSWRWNSQNFWEPPIIGFPWCFYPWDLSTLSLQQFISYRFRFPSRAQILPEVWAPGFLFCKCNSLYSPFGLSNFGDSSFACDFTFLINILKSCGFYSLLSLIIRIE